MIGDNARALLAECEAGSPGWPFDAGTKAAIQEARSKPTDAGLERLLGLHLALGLQCRVTHKENTTLHRVIDHMKEESIKRQRQQQDHINLLKTRLARSESSTAAARGDVAKKYADPAAHAAATSMMGSSISRVGGNSEGSMMISGANSFPHHETLSPGNYMQLAEPEPLEYVASQATHSDSSAPLSTSQHAIDRSMHVPSVRNNTAKRISDPRAMVRQRLAAASYRNGKRDFPSLFRHYDRNNNGDISLKEFISLVRRDGKIARSAMSDEELERMFVRDVDKDQSGSIEYGEFEAWILNTSVPSISANRSSANQYTHSSPNAKARGRDHPNLRHARSSSTMSTASTSSSPGSPGRNKKKLHMTVSRQARARRSIRQALLHLADQNGHKSNSVSAAAIHEIWHKVFRVHTLRGETSLGISEFRRALRVALKISAAELSDTHVRGLFETIDDTGDGFIEFQEFRDWLTGARSKRKKSLQVLEPTQLRDQISSMIQKPTSAISDSSPSASGVLNGSSPSLRPGIDRTGPRERAKAANEYTRSQKQARAIPAAKPESLMQRLGMTRRSHRAAKMQNSPPQPTAKQPAMATNIASTTLLDDPYLRSHPGSLSPQADVDPYAQLSPPAPQSTNKHESKLSSPSSKNKTSQRPAEMYTPSYMHSQVRQLKSSYRKEYAVHLSRENSDARPSSDHTYAERFRDHRKAPSTETTATELSTSAGKRRQRRSTIISPRHRQETLLRTRKEEKERAKNERKKRREAKQDDDSEEPDDQFLSSVHVDTQNYEEMIRTLDGRLLSGVDEVRARRKSYSTIAQDVSVAYTDGNTSFHDFDSSEPPSDKKTSRVRELSHDKRAPTWVLTQGIAEEEEDHGTAESSFHFSTLSRVLPNRAQPAAMNDNGKRAEARAKVSKRVNASKALYGDDHTVVDLPDTPIAGDQQLETFASGFSGEALSSLPIAEEEDEEDHA